MAEMCSINPFNVVMSIIVTNRDILYTTWMKHYRLQNGPWPCMRPTECCRLVPLVFVAAALVVSEKCWVRVGGNNTMSCLSGFGGDPRGDTGPGRRARSRWTQRTCMGGRRCRWCYFGLVGVGRTPFVVLLLRRRQCSDGLWRRQRRRLIDVSAATTNGRCVIRYVDPLF